MLLLPTHAPFTTQLRHVACFARRMSGKKGNTAKGFGLNSFAVLSQAAEEIETTITQSAKAQSATSKERLLRDPLVWVDLEMTGLDLEQHTIIEVACIVTDGDLQTRIEGPSLVIHQPEDVLERMNDWSKEQHAKSGLTECVRQSKVTLQEAEQEVLEFVKKHVPGVGIGLLAGNSVHVDRMFLMKYMPQLTAHLSYRILDVSTVKELAKRWYPNAVRKAPRKTNAHTALSDIRESIEELTYYRKSIFLGGGKGKGA